MHLNFDINETTYGLRLVNLTIWAPASTAAGKASGSTEETQICKNRI